MYNQSNQALSGIRVLDFTQILSGPFATMLLADAGADVVKIERPKTGDPTRHWGPPFVNEESVYFAAFNRGKRSIELDLRDSEDLEIVKQLALKADVVIENIRPGSMTKRGLGYKSLKKINPKIIYISIRGYSEYSKRANDPGLEVILESESGLMSITGPGEGGNPVRLGVAAIDMMAGTLAVSYIYSALFERERTGEGQYMSISLEETAALLMTHPWLMYLNGQTEYKPSGSAHPNIAPYEVFQTKDKKVMLGAVDDQQFNRLAKAINRLDWLEDSKWKTNRARVRNRKELHDAIEAEFLNYSAEYLRDLFAKAKLPVGIVESVVSAADNWASSDMPKIKSKHPVLGHIQWPTSPWLKNGGHTSPPPLLGSSKKEVLSDWLK